MLISHSEAQIHQYSIQTPCTVEMAGPCPSLPRSPQKVRMSPRWWPVPWAAVCQGRMALERLELPPSSAGQCLLSTQPCTGLSPAVPREPLSPPCGLQHPLAMPRSVQQKAWGASRAAPSPAPAAPVPQTCHTHNDPVFLATLSCLRGKVNPEQNKEVRKVQCWSHVDSSDSLGEFTGHCWQLEIGRALCFPSSSLSNI